MTKQLQQATLAAGCFWCIEAAFKSVQGIESAISGYMGGNTSQATYEQVCTGTSGHAEVVQLSFDPQLINYREILEIFFSLHNPTQLNRQGHDTGSQYRSAIFVHDSEQEKIASDIIKEIIQEQIWPDPVVTQLEPLSQFFSGEDHHQDYFANNSENQYCQAVISPKLAKFKQTFARKLK